MRVKGGDTYELCAEFARESERTRRFLVAWRRARECYTSDGEDG